MNAIVQPFPLTVARAPKQKIERFMSYMLLPLLAGLATAGASWYCGFGPDLPDQGALLGFAGSVASIAATMLGFMLAALAVLASINNTTLVERMKKTGHYDNLLRTVFFGCMLFLLIALSGFALLFGAPRVGWHLSALLGLHVAALLSLLDIGRKFHLVLTNLR